MMLAFAGFLMIAVLVVLLVKFKMVPISVFATLPLITALLLGYSFSEVMKMVALGVVDVLPTATVFVGSITYFGIMNDVGLFDRPINWLLRHVKMSVFSVLLVTACIAMLSHLDGSGVSTLMITIPAMMPIAKKLKIRALPLSFIVTMTVGVMNFLPWGGPLGRAAVVIGSDPVILWKQILPAQIAGIVMIFISCYLLAKSEEKKGFAAVSTDVQATTSEDSDLKRPHLFWVNLILTIILIVLLFLGVPAFLPFLIGLGIALPLNYGKGGEKAQNARIKAHAGSVVPMILTIIGAGMFLGVLTDTGLTDAMATAIVSVIPESLGGFVHIIMGILAIPLSLVFEADTMNLGILPVVAQISSNYGVSTTASALAIAIGHNMGIGMCMTSASVYFGLGMFELEYSDALKYSFLKTMAFGTIFILFSAVIGVI